METLSPETLSASETLAAFDVHPIRGFLPVSDPPRRLPPAFDAWEDFARELDKHLIAGTARRSIRELPELDPSTLEEPGDIARAMLLLSYFGHAYIWGERTAVDRLPANLAIPWHATAVRLGRPPVLSYASHALNNWRRLNPAGPVALGNIARLENFLGGADEDWFVLVHVDIEGRAGPAMEAIVEAQNAVIRDCAAAVEIHLGTIAGVLHQMLATLSRMPEQCDPYIYYNRVRPFIFGWKDNPALPEGVWYDGVSEYTTGQYFRGETGAQSSIVPAIHGALGISYASDPLREHVIGMRDYMPPKHRAFIAHVEQGPSIRQFVQQQHKNGNTALSSLYNECVTGVYKFQEKHLEYAGRYIHAQAQRATGNPVDVGTGGTPFMVYLKKHADDLNGYLL
ncbi:MAG TPA: hypothetical protein VK399_12040 [Longimicrobiaceae bacterium]|nr:hypothetical protein [Longimicrobiaceae bacterium]